MSREIRSPVYQIDFTAVDAGKRIASSKRRIRWRFGFTNQDALASGETGTACRGEEHDITLIWSLTSGKRLVLADGQEVHYSNSRSQIFDFSWTMRGNHVLKVVSHSTTPMNAHPNFRQYDFFVDGMSFFSMPKVYRLGLTGAEPVQDSGTLALAHSSRRSAYGNYSVGPGGPGLGAVGLVGGGGGHGHGHPGSGSRSLGSPGHNRGPSSIVEIEAPHNEQEEEAYLREAIKASLSNQDPDIPVNANSNLSTASYNGGGYDQGGHGGGGMGATNADDDLLIDFMSEPGPAPAPAPTGQISGGGFDAFAMAMVPAAAPPASIYSNAQPPPNAAPVPSYDQYNAAPAAPAPYAAPFQSVPAPMPMPPANAPPVPTAYPTQFAPPVPAPAPARAPPTPPAPVPAASLTMAPQSTGLGSDANAAYAKFASMDQFDLVKPKNNNAQKDRSNPFDDPAPASSSNSGVGTKTLADMKAKNHQQGGKKEVMKASSMVVAQQQGGSWDVGGAGGGPPAPGGYNNYGMQMQGPPQMQGQYGMGMGMGMNSPPPAMGGMQPGYPPQQQQQQLSGYGQGQPSQQPPMQGAPMQQQYQQPQQGYGYGQPQQQQQPF
mmetsp:Transcript_7894/g.11920  ORF Transcript_7894/g.11920 Transcript_7894/m.11920 type:complete len:603 (-) Transcript_7894:326-2134(-)